MRTLTLASLLLGTIALVAAAETAKPLTPEEAIKKVDEKVLVEMRVKTTKDRLEKRGEIYLDSEENFRDKKNLGIVITRAGAGKLKEAGIDNPALHFKDKIIRVRGTVTIKEQLRRIEVDEAKQIEVVK